MANNKLKRGNWSPDNPYYAQFETARNRRELVRLRDSALEWESTRQNSELQLEDQRALRDEEREYNTPEAQLQREREAGLNPDLQGGTAVGAGSSGSVPQVPLAPATDLVPTTPPTEVANTVFNGVGAVASLASALDTGLNFVKGLSTFNDFLRGSSASADTAENVAGTSKNQMMSSGISLANQTLDFAGAIVESLDTNEPLTSERLKEAIANTGYDDADGSMLKQVERLSKSPQLQKLYRDRQVAARQSQAREMAMPLEFFEKLENNMAHVMSVNSEIAKIDEDFAYFIATVYQTEENARQTAENLSNELDNQTTAINLDAQSYENQRLYIEQSRKEFKRYIKSYCEQCDFIARRIEDIDEKIFAAANDTTIPENARKAAVLALKVERSQLYSTGCNTLSHAYDIVKRVARDEYIKPYFFETDKEGNAEIKTIPVNLNHNAFMEVLFGDYMNNGLTVDALLGNIINAGASIATGGIASTTGMRGQNINQQNIIRGQNIMQRGQNMLYMQGIPQGMMPPVIN